MPGKWRWRRSRSNERAKCATKVKERSGTRRHQARTTAADGGRQRCAAGKLPVAMISSLLGTVIVTRRLRRVTYFAFSSGGAPTGASTDITLYKAATTAALAAAMPTVTII